MPAYIGTTQTFSSIPSLLLSSLQEVDDPKVRTALYQIQDFCNSIGAVHGSTGSTTATLGTHSPATTATPATWTKVSLNGVPAFIPVWT